MVNGMVKEAKVLHHGRDHAAAVCFPFPLSSSVAANTAAEWGNVAVPTVQYTHGMISCSEFTGVPLITLLEIAGADLKNGKFVLAEGGERLVDDPDDPDEPDLVRRGARRVWSER
jgi:sulfane dehydrogenase subunit SoxC